VAAPFVPRWNGWTAGFGGARTTDGKADLGSNTAAGRVYASAVGADYLISPFTIAGFAMAGGGTSFGVNGRGSGRSDLFQAGGFVRHGIGAAYITGSAAYGWQDITMDRTVAIDGTAQLHSRLNANTWSGRIETGYRVIAQWTGIGITPYAAGQFSKFDLPSYSEQAQSGPGTFALNYSSKSVADTRSEIGLRTDRSFAVANAVLTLRGRAAWAHDFDTNRSIETAFQGLPGTIFVVNGARAARDSALATASGEWAWRNGVSFGTSFEGEFSDVTRSYAGKGVVRYVW
jgi:uncharacterized protein with beta-barrel porin domain